MRSLGVHPRHDDVISVRRVTEKEDKGHSSISVCSVVLDLLRTREGHGLLDACVKSSESISHLPPTKHGPSNILAKARDVYR